MEKNKCTMKWRKDGAHYGLKIDSHIRVYFEKGKKIGYYCLKQYASISEAMFIAETEYKQDCIKRILRAKGWNPDEEIKWIGDIAYHCGYRLHITRYVNGTCCLIMQEKGNNFSDINYNTLAEAEADTENQLYNRLWSLI
jgi:hypothetical protein